MIYINSIYHLFQGCKSKRPVSHEGIKDRTQIPRTPLLEERRIQEAGRRVIAAAAASMTHAMPICELCEASADSAFCLYLPAIIGGRAIKKSPVAIDEA
jgi:hypothetical protein